MLVHCKYLRSTQSGHFISVWSLLFLSAGVNMADYIFFMHDDAPAEESDWGPYFAKLKSNGCFEGGSAIGDGVCVRKRGEVSPLTSVAGYIRVNADDLNHAKSMLAGNPHFEAGGTVEIRELPRTD